MNQELLLDTAVVVVVDRKLPVYVVVDHKVVVVVDVEVDEKVTVTVVVVRKCIFLAECWI